MCGGKWNIIDVPEARWREREGKETGEREKGRVGEEGREGEREGERGRGGKERIKDKC